MLCKVHILKSKKKDHEYLSLINNLSCFVSSLFNEVLLQKKEDLACVLYNYFRGVEMCGGEIPTSELYLVMDKFNSSLRPSSIEFSYCLLDEHSFILKKIKKENREFKTFIIDSDKFLPYHEIFKKENKYKTKVFSEAVDYAFNLIFD